ncbi:hypothetical protein BKA70DRAFT_1267200 [Coprinopsis sp. MPI-PUGE-AT-0042]|nr:hypothetical protein BKA70DRAFT_1267200 [Coprinopsis sp. MPI-PUGE-AT-0042]
MGNQSPRRRKSSSTSAAKAARNGKSQTLTPAEKRLATLKAKQDAAKAAEAAAAAELAAAEAEAAAEAAAAKAAKKKVSKSSKKADSCSPSSSHAPQSEGRAPSPMQLDEPRRAPSSAHSRASTPVPGARGAGGPSSSGEDDVTATGVARAPTTLEEAQKLIEGLTMQLKEVTSAAQQLSEVKGKTKKAKSIKPITKPKGKFVLQKRMKLDRDPKGHALYNKILAVVRRHCVAVQMNPRGCYRKQPIEKIGSVQLLARKEVKYLTEKRFPQSWTTAEMIKNWIQNQKRARAKRIKARRAEGRPADSDDEMSGDDDSDEEDNNGDSDEEEDDEDEADEGDGDDFDDE